MLKAAQGLFGGTGKDNGQQQEEKYALVPLKQRDINKDEQEEKEALFQLRSLAREQDIAASSDGNSDQGKDETNTMPVEQQQVLKQAEISQLIEQQRQGTEQFIFMQQAQHKTFMHMLQEQHEQFLKTQQEQTQQFLQQQQKNQLNPYMQQPLVSIPLPQNNSILAKNKKVHQSSMPFLIGACSALVWIMQNGFIPTYNSLGSVWLSIWYGPALIGWLIYMLGSSIEQTRYHRDNVEAGGLHTPQLEMINSECKWLGLRVALSLVGAQILSRIVFAQELDKTLEKAMGGWSGQFLDAMPIEFHLFMMLASAIGFALCFGAMTYFRQKDKLTTLEMWSSVGVGLFIGAGLYIAHLLPGMNETHHWGIPKGVSLLIAALANCAVFVTALSVNPALVEVTHVTPTRYPSTFCYSNLNEVKLKEEHINDATVPVATSSIVPAVSAM